MKLVLMLEGSYNDQWDISSSKNQKQTKRLQSVLQKDLSSGLTSIRLLSLKNLRLHHHQTEKIILVGMVGKYNKNIFQHVGRIISEKLSMSKSLKYSLDIFGKGFCFSMAHLGINKFISNVTIIENYQKAIEGI